MELLSAANHATTTCPQHPGLVSVHQVIRVPTSVDICLGRGRSHTGHPGNIKLTAIINTYSKAYDSAKLRKDKTLITEYIVDAVSKLGGRFLSFEENLDGWVEISREAARKRVSQLLRNRRLPKYMAARAAVVAAAPPCEVVGVGGTEEDVSSTTDEDEAELPPDQATSRDDRAGRCEELPRVQEAGKLPRDNEVAGKPTLRENHADEEVIGGGETPQGNDSGQVVPEDSSRVVDVEESAAAANTSAVPVETATAREDTSMAEEQETAARAIAAAALAGAAAAETEKPPSPRGALAMSSSNADVEESSGATTRGTGAQLHSAAAPVGSRLVLAMEQVDAILLDEQEEENALCRMDLLALDSLHARIRRLDELVTRVRTVKLLTDREAALEQQQQQLLQHQLQQQQQQPQQLPVENQVLSAELARQMTLSGYLSLLNQGYNGLYMPR